MEIGHRPVYLPSEILSLIAHYGKGPCLRPSFVNREFIKNLRLTSKAFEFAAAPYLIDLLWISTREEDCQKMQAVADHPIFRRHVDTIAYDFTSYEKFLARNRKVYAEALGDANEPPEYDYVNARQKGSLRTTIPPDAKRLGWHTYRAEFLRQSLAPLPAFTDNVSNGCELPIDSKCLFNCLPKLPKVKTFMILDDRWNNDRHYWTEMPRHLSSFDGNRCISFSMHENLPPIVRYGKRRWSVQSQKAAVINPRPYCVDPADDEWDIDTERAANRAFFVLTHAISKLKLTKVESLETQDPVQGLSNCIFTGVSAADTLEWLDDELGLDGPGLDLVPPMDEHHLRHACNAFQFLKQINLEFTISPEDDFGQFWATLRQGTIGKIVQCARGVTHLTLGLRNRWYGVFHIPELSSLLGDETFPCLQSVAMYGMHFTQTDMIGFLTRHKNTLYSLEWECLAWPDDTVQQYYDPDWGFDDCREKIQEIGRIGLHLKAISICAASGNGDFFVEHDDPAQIAYFLLSGLKPPRHFGTGPTREIAICDIPDGILQAFFDEDATGFNVDDIRYAAGVTHFTHRWEVDEQSIVLRKSLEGRGSEIDYSKASFHYGTEKFRHGSYEAWRQSRQLV